MGNKNEWNIGVCIAKLRENRGLSQKQLSDELGKLGLKVRRETVTQWENGTRDLKTEYTIKLADFFGVSCDYILRGIDAENKSAAEETGLSNSSVNSLKRLSDMSWKHGSTGVTPAILLDKMVASKHFIGLIIQFYDYYISKMSYLEKRDTFVQKYKEYSNREPDDILTSAAQCANYDLSPLKSASYVLLKQQEMTDFEMYKLERAMRTLAEECTIEQ